MATRKAARPGAFFPPFTFYLPILIAFFDANLLMVGVVTDQSTAPFAYRYKSVNLNTSGFITESAVTLRVTEDQSTLPWQQEKLRDLGHSFPSSPSIFRF